MCVIVGYTCVGMAMLKYWHKITKPTKIVFKDDF